MTIITYEVILPVLTFLAFMWLILPVLLHMWAFIVPYFRRDVGEALDARADLHADMEADRIKDEVAAERERHHLHDLNNVVNMKDHVDPPQRDSDKQDRNGDYFYEHERPTHVEVNPPLSKESQ